MNLAELECIQDLTALRAAANKALLERDAIIHRHTQELQYRQTKIDALLFELARLQRWRYSAQSEQLTAHQRRLFEESLDEDIQALEQALQAEQPEITDPVAPRAPTPKRQILPAHLDRIEHRYERVDCQCDVCH